MNELVLACAWGNTGAWVSSLFFLWVAVASWVAGMALLAFLGATRSRVAQALLALSGAGLLLLGGDRFAVLLDTTDQLSGLSSWVTGGLVLAGMWTPCALALAYRLWREEDDSRRLRRTRGCTLLLEEEGVEPSRLTADSPAA